MELISKAACGTFTDDDFLYFVEQDEMGKDSYFCYKGRQHKVINHAEYFIARYGIHYEKIMAHLKDKIAAKAIHNDGTIFVCFYQESIPYHFDQNGYLLRTFDQMKNIDTVYDIALQGNSIWCAYPTSHTVKRFSLEDGKEELTISDGHIGLDRGSIFCYPESITVLGNDMYVADMGNQRICKVDLLTMGLNSYMTFNEPVFGYEKLRDMEFVLLDSGLYKI